MHTSLYKLIGLSIAVSNAFARDCCFAISQLGIGVTNTPRPYFSLQQSALTPACVVHPTAAAQIGRILALGSTGSCEFKFAVRSGGHMTWPGASSIDAPGFLIDLGHLRGIDYNDTTEVITFGAGLRWKDVYNHLDPYGRIARGGRISDVGVGGLLLGGGISFPPNTFSSELVIDYEVVLASGQVVHANATSHVELFQALKLGSTNFGIVTQFAMPTSLDTPVWTGEAFAPMDDKEKILDTLVDLTLGLGKQVTEVMLVTMGCEGRISVLGLAREYSPGMFAVQDTDAFQPKSLKNFYDDLNQLDFAKPATYHDYGRYNGEIST